MMNEEISQSVPDMPALKKLLAHPVFVLKQLSFDLYEEEGAAAYERLRSRVTGRYRFRKEECQKLHKIFITLAKAFRKASKKLEKLLDSPDKLEWHILMPLLDYPHINLKAIIEPIGQKYEKNYFQTYDALRRRSAFTETLCTELVFHLQQLAHDIEEQIKLSKDDAKKYTFNGNGGQVEQ
jgi:hypothetical protein